MRDKCRVQRVQSLGNDHRFSRDICRQLPTQVPQLACQFLDLQKVARVQRERLCSGWLSSPVENGLWLHLRERGGWEGGTGTDGPCDGGGVGGGGYLPFMEYNRPGGSDYMRMCPEV